MRRALVLVAVALAGFAGGAAVTRDVDTVPPGAGAPTVYEDGSWVLDGCIPGRLCELDIELE